MLNRFVRDESGIALGLAVIMILLIGVMGAGLLVFVRNDLEAVVEVNQGQKAFEIADSGVQVAKQQIRANKTPSHYDVDGMSPIFFAAGCNIGGEDETSNWSPEDGGVSRDFAGGQFNVTIRWLSQDPSVDSRCAAPETNSSPPPSVDYFKVVSTGTYGNAKRKVEAIYSTYDLNVPKGYFTPNTINVRGSAEITDVSLFSLGNVNIANNAEITGTDLIYGNWKNEVNPTARSVDDAGVGATGTVTNDVLGRDYDSTIESSIDREMVTDITDPASQITFPFRPSRQPDLNLLRDIAIQQEQEDPSTDLHYYTFSGGSPSLDNWPENSDENTVVYVEFSGASSNTLKWSVNGNCNDNPPKKGTLVIRNGNFTTQPNTALFQGVVIVRGGEALDETAEGTSDDTGKTCLDGFVNASGDIKIAGNASPLSTSALEDRPGFYGVRQWSWRECYSEDCK